MPQIVYILIDYPALILRRSSSWPRCRSGALEDAWVVTGLWVLYLGYELGIKYEVLCTSASGAPRCTSSIRCWRWPPPWRRCRSTCTRAPGPGQRRLAFSSTSAPAGGTKRNSCASSFAFLSKRLKASRETWPKLSASTIAAARRREADLDPLELRVLRRGTAFSHSRPSRVPPR